MNGFSTHTHSLVGVVTHAGRCLLSFLPLVRLFFTSPLLSPAFPHSFSSLHRGFSQSDAGVLELQFPQCFWGMKDTGFSEFCCLFSFLHPFTCLVFLLFHHTCILSSSPPGPSLFPYLAFFMCFLHPSLPPTSSLALGLCFLSSHHLLPLFPLLSVGFWVDNKATRQRLSTLQWETVHIFRIGMSFVLCKCLSKAAVSQLRARGQRERRVRISNWANLM